MKAIDRLLSWAHRLQISCFGTPISVTIEVSKGIISGKIFSVTTDVGLEHEIYLFYSSASDQDLYQKWGKLKDNVSKLLDKHVGHKLNKHGREKET